MDTRVSYGQTKLKLAPIDLRELLGQLCEELRLMAEEAGVQLAMDGSLYGCVQVSVTL